MKILVTSSPTSEVFIHSAVKNALIQYVFFIMNCLCQCWHKIRITFSQDFGLLKNTFLFLSKERRDIFCVPLSAITVEWHFKSQFCAGVTVGAKMAALKLHWHHCKS